MPDFLEAVCFMPAARYEAVRAAFAAAGVQCQPMKAGCLALGPTSALAQALGCTEAELAPGKSVRISGALTGLVDRVSVSRPKEPR